MAGKNNWEFLLQQEGDRSWLPLESPDVEILEGRYRVMVKNVAPNAVMDIRITHESTSEDPPKRRTQVRSGKSNAMGLVVVIPFTQMSPGIWELACVPNDLMSDLMGHQGQYSVQLHVLPKESDVAGEWEPDWSQPAAESKTEPAKNPVANPSPVETPVAAQPAIVPPSPVRLVPAPAVPVSLEQQEEALVDQLALPSEVEDSLGAAEDDLLATLDALTEEPLTEEPAIEVPDEASPQPPILGASEPHVPPELGARGPLADRASIVLTLQPDTYEIQAAQTVVLQGQVQADSHSGRLRQRSGVVPNCTFVVRVRDPQQGEVVVETSTPFTQIVLPFDMQLGVVLPATLPGQMLMGEVCLMDDETGDVLTRQSFTFFALLADVLASIAQDLNPQTRPAAVDELPHPPAEPAGPEFDDQFLGLINQPANQPANPTTAFQSQSSSQLPPKLYQPDPDRPDRSAPSLPSFLNMPTPETNVESLFETDLEEGFDGIALDDDDLDLSFDDVEDPLVTAEEALSEDQILAEVPVLEAPNAFEMTPAEMSHLFDDGLDEALEADEAGIYNRTAPLDLDDPDDLKTIDVNAQALPDRFESLNLGDRFMDRMSAFAEETHTEATNAVPPAPEAPVNPFASVVGRSSEAVIMDEWLPTIGLSGLDLGDNPLLIPADEMVPTPSLEIEVVNEVVAGQSLAVKVKLPMIQPKLYVKLWINDRQTRTLLDGPRYLVDFVPDRLNQNLEATTQLTVPLGSLEIQIEAIAIETATKREGYKVSSALVVVPPNLPSLEVNDFGF
jgi:hypothetical protein